MAPNDKQERRLMRQRGAGPRELKNAAFSFSFGSAALPSQPSARNLPRRPSPSKTPLPTRLSSRKTPTTRPSAAANATSSRQSTQSANINTPLVTGKRKRASRSQPPETELESERDELEVNKKDVEASRGTTAGLYRSVGAEAAQTSAINITSERDDLSPDQPIIPDDFALPELRRTSIPFLTLNPVERRPAPSPDRRPPRGERGRSRTRKSVVSSYSLSTSRLSAVGEEDEADTSEGIVAATSASPSIKRVPDTDASTARRTTGTSTFDGGTSAFLRKHAAESTRREVFEISDEGSSSDDDLTPKPAKKRLRRSQPNVDILVESTDQAMEDQDELSPPQLAAQRPRKSQSEIEILVDTEDQEIEDEDELSELQETVDESLTIRTPLADTTANTRREPLQQDKPRPKSAPRKNKSTSNLPAKAPRTKGGPTVSITVYRRTKKPSTNDDDPLGIDPNPGVPTLNAADVLYQITTEIVNTYITNVPTASARSSGTTTSKKTLRYQIQALQSFRDELADALRAITFAQLGVYRFGSEIRKARRLKRELREELMGRRREREDLEVRIDAVRTGYLDQQRQDEERRTLVQDLVGIADAVRRGREKQKGGEEVVERSLEMELGDAVNSLGLLGRVREFNTFLEGAAGALEGRT